MERIKLLYEYGGVWLDTDTIVMRNLAPIMKKLENWFWAVAGEGEGIEYIAP